ncbi:MAG TPA: dTDP-4-dehydrorhamnose reductase, partial [Roseiflexaceae bacterium]|nr:dTDP-4-dehydrorhamnose reductase [Roseiflexaceae bacterium]
ATGQLGSALRQVLEPDHDLVLLGHGEIELGDPASIDRVAATGADLVIHSAAWTNVDACAREPERAYRVNGLGTRYVALACRRLGARMVYISTNEVFDGAGAQPYFEYDRANPINAYGRSKWIGEQAVRELVDRSYIARVAWLFGGERNFIRTVMRLANERGALKMVDDEIGTPTYTYDAAAAIAQLINSEAFGTYHIVNEGACSRAELAAEALRAAQRGDVPIEPIKLADFKRDSVVPPYTALRNIAAADLGITLRPWQEAVAAFVATL